MINNKIVTLNKEDYMFNRNIEINNSKRIYRIYVFFYIDIPENSEKPSLKF